MNFKGVPGHEFVGIVEQYPNKNWLGKKVVGEINAGCGSCDYCRQGLERHCPSRTTLGISGRNGAFAQYLTLPMRNLHFVPPEMDNYTAVFTEPLSAALEIAEQIKIQPNWKTLIIGDGKLAALIAQTLRLHGLTIDVIGKIPAKLELFKKWNCNILQNEPEALEYDLVIEASGSPSGWETAVNSVKPRGIIILKSTYQGKLDFNPAPLVINEITLIGSRCGRFEPALRLLKTGLIQIQPLISKVFNFDDILEALIYSQRIECMKVLVDFPPED